MKHRLWVWITVGAFLMYYIALGVGSALGESLTYDEIVHIEEGKNAILRHEFLIDTNNPPLIRELAVIPLLLNTGASKGEAVPHIQAFPARMVILMLGVALGIGVYLVAAGLFGIDVGLFALFLYVVNPTVLAYSHYVTQDIGAALFFFLGYMSLIWLMKQPSWKMFILHGIALGALLATKITLLAYYLVADFIVVPYVLRSGIGSWFKKYPLHILVSVLVCFMTLWSTYFFTSNVIVAPSDARGRVSARVREFARDGGFWILERTLDVLEREPVPLGDYIAIVKNTVIRATRPTETFFRGNTYEKSSWYFMGVNTITKTPIVLIVLFVLGGWAMMRNRKSRLAGIMLVVPIVSVLAVSSFSSMQPFVRYILPLYPFVSIIAGYSVLVVKDGLGKIILFAACVWLIADTLSFYPHFISYVTPFAGSRERAFEQFIDSNIDWGQSLPDLKQFADTEKPRSMSLSYFGRDNAAVFGFASDVPYGSYKFNEICAMHDVFFPANSGEAITAISVSNWRYCGYDLDPRFQPENVTHVVGKSILIFSGKFENTQ